MARAFIFALFAATVSALPYLSSDDAKVLTANLKEQLTSDRVEIAYYAAAALKQLGVKVDSPQCKLAQEKAQNPKDLIELQAAVGLAEIIGASCKASTDKVKAMTDEVFNSETPKAIDVYNAIRSIKSSGSSLDSNKASSAIANAVAKDDSATSLAYAFNAATLLDAKTAKSLKSKIEDLVGQADEIDSTFKQIDGSVVATSLAVSGIFGVLDKSGATESSVKPDDMLKFANYVLSKRTVRNAKSAYFTLLAIDALAKNKLQVPISVTLVNAGAVVSEASPRIQVHVSDVLGNSVNAVSVTAEKITSESDMKDILTRQVFSPVSSTNTEYAFTLIDGKSTREAGFYTIYVQANADKDKKYIGGAKSTRLQVKVTTKASIKNAELSVHDAEVSPSASNTHKLTPPSTLPTKLSASNHDKIRMSFNVVNDKTGKSMKPHQTFAVFTHQKTQQEIIFVAEPGKSDAIVWTTDLSKAGKEFGYLSGAYSIHMVVGDASIENGVNWHVADVDIQFKNGQAAPSDDKYATNYKPAREIHHTFREPEKRPPQTLSDLFSLLCLAPVLVMLVGFLRVGVNFNNMPLNPFTLGFHAGLGGILFLYFTFWLRLNMFTTLKYLALIGAVTFICGNRMLAAMADRRKTKEQKSE